MSSLQSTSGSAPAASIDPSRSQSPIAVSSSIVQKLRRRALEQPHGLAFAFLADGEGAVDRRTHLNIDREARTIAAWLQSQGAQGERVLLLFPSGLEFITAFLGCLYAGAVAVPLAPPRRPRSQERFLAIAVDANATIALTTDEIGGRLRECLTEASGLLRLRIQSTSDLDQNLAEGWRELAPDADRLAFLQYTSGSTATPKGVMVSHGNLEDNLRQIQTKYTYDRNSVMVSWLPLYHDMGLIGSVLLPVYIGFPCYLMDPTAFLQRPLRWLRAIDRYKATTSGGPDFAYDLCTRKINDHERAGLNLRSWRIAVNGAEPVRAETMHAFAAAFTPCGFALASFYASYGMAESTLLITVNGGISPCVYTVDTADLAQNRIAPAKTDRARAKTLVCCGLPLPNQRIIIVDPVTRVACPPNRVGEIWVSGASVAQGYWNQPHTSALAFNAHLSDCGDGPFLRTGDLGFVHEAGVYITGRLKDLIIIRGRNLYPQDIEQSVERSYPAGQRGLAAAFSIELEGSERLVVVHELTRESQRSADTKKIIAAIRQFVTEEHETEIHAVVLLRPGSLPKTSSGKVQRHACRAAYQSHELAVVDCWIDGSNREKAAIPPMVSASAENIEEWLIKWISSRSVCDPRTIDPNQSFADFGLDSMALAEMGGELEIWLGRSLREVEAWNYPTPRQLAKHLADREIAIVPPSSMAANEGALAQLVAEIEQMSEAESLAGIDRMRLKCGKLPHD